MIEVTALTKTFGRVVAAGDVSFRLDRGEALALWGPNGAGKTTVIRCLLGLLRYRGRITVAGLDARRAGKACRRAMGYVPQELAFHGDLRVDEAAHFFARLKRAGRDRPGIVLDHVGLAGDARKRIGELSGGMKQRLALAIALLADPPILVLDELTSNLDRAAQGAFLARLADLKAAGKTILFASHRADEVELLADRVLGLDRGRRRFECPPAELAEAAGLRCVLRIQVEEREVDRAADVLRQGAFAVSRNGRGLYVETDACRKGAPFEALGTAGIRVIDFELAGDRPPGRGGADRG